MSEVKITTIRLLPEHINILEKERNRLQKKYNMYFSTNEIIQLLIEFHRLRLNTLPVYTQEDQLALHFWKERMKDE